MGRLLVAALVGAFVGCGSSDSCEDIGGVWYIAQHCDSSVVGQQVTITASGCKVQCSSPFDGWSGSVSGSSIGMSGPAGSEMLSCTGTISGSSISLGCPGSGGTCAVVLSRQGDGGAQPP